MKHLFLTIALMAMVAVSAQATGIVKETETFTISTNDNVDLNQNFDKSWTIEYGENNKNIQVFKVTTKKGEEYIVRNQFFEVSYVNTKNGFGVKNVKRAYSTVDPRINNNVINSDEMKNQSLLSSKELSEEKALGYIAGFVPYLLNDNYKHILN